MAKKKKGRRKQGLFSKAANIGLILFGFQRVLFLALQGRWQDITSEATFGLADSTPGNINFDLGAGLRMYTPVAGAVGLGKLKSYLMRKFPVR